MTFHWKMKGSVSHRRMFDQGIIICSEFFPHLHSWILFHMRINCDTLVYGLCYYFSYNRRKVRWQALHSFGLSQILIQIDGHQNPNLGF